ncbi:MAG: hypothetical protein LUH58_02545 [Lachnospiraceae bacterium]|nr:hypothetical protein [Lachnospiraceae bacterium]
MIEGDGRDLSMIEDGSIDSILTDHPWLDPKSNKGGSRFFCGNAKKILRRISQFPEDIERNDRKMFYKCCLKAYNEAIREMHRARLGFAGDKWRCKIES